MKSFIGINMKEFRGYNREYFNIPIRSGYQYYYFCAVDENFVWKNNIHIPFREKKGSEIKINNEFVDCHIMDAELLPISDKYIDWSLPQSKDRYFNTCRNWQFANMIKNSFPLQSKLF